MDPLSIALVGGSIAAPIIGGLFGQHQASGDRAASAEAVKRALETFQAVDIPDIEKQRLALEMLKSEGVYTPEMEQLVQMGPTAMEGISVDPRLRTAQMTALDTLSKMGTEGLTAEDRMQLNAARRSVSGDAESRRQAILASMQSRGMGGSGMELASQLSSSQQAADRAAQESDRLMAMAQNRMLNAVSQAGSLGGQIRGQEFGEQEAAARAKDAIAQFNAQQQAATQTRNIGNLNQAQLANLQERQRIADANTAARNAEQQFNKGLYQTRFQNEMSKAGGMAGAYGNQAQQLAGQAQATAGMYAGIGSGIGQGLTGLAGYLNKPAAKTADVQKSTPVAFGEANDAWMEYAKPPGVK